jgi:hypothetical protein
MRENRIRTEYTKQHTPRHAQHNVQEKDYTRTMNIWRPVARIIFRRQIQRDEIVQEMIRYQFRDPRNLIIADDGETLCTGVGVIAVHEWHHSTIEHERKLRYIRLGIETPQDLTDSHTALSLTELDTAIALTH